MEDVWKDIQLSSLHESTTTTIFQDFLSPRLKPPTARGGERDIQDEEDDQRASVSNPCFMASLNSSSLKPLAVGSTSSSSACSPCVLLGCFSRKHKRVCDDSGSDPRYKRMMKNRESAARSRARRQAYTCELEKEAAQLMEENAKLKEQLQQQEQLQLSAPAAENEIPKKRTHTRSLTAPF